MLSTSKLPCTVLETGIHLVLFVSTSSLGRDEKGCKMDVDGINQVEKGVVDIAQLEKCSLVDVHPEKCSPYHYASSLS